MRSVQWGLKLGEQVHIGARTGGAGGSNCSPNNFDGGAVAPSCSPGSRAYVQCNSYCNTQARKTVTFGSANFSLQ